MQSLPEIIYLKNNPAPPPWRLNGGPGKTPQDYTPLKLYPGRFWDLPKSRPEYILDYTSWKILGVPESTAPAQDLPPFSQFGEVSLDPIYPSSTNLYVRPSQILPPPPPRI